MNKKEIKQKAIEFARSSNSKSYLHETGIIDGYIKGYEASADKKELPDNYWFHDEHGSVAVVIEECTEWCVMQNEGVDEPYVLSKEFVVSIYKESNTNPL